MTVQQSEKPLSMVEKVARAIAWADLKEMDRVAAERDGLSSDSIVVDEPLRKLARAAIEAMREPTDAMIDAGVEAKLNLYRDLERQGKNTRCMLVADHPAGTIYVGMIDAALSEESTP